jgi:hypothetical protein
MPPMPRSLPRKNANKRDTKRVKRVKVHHAATRTSTNQAPADFPARVAAALARGEPDAIADDDLQRELSAAVRLYAAKAERRNGGLKPFPDGAITATETVVAACALIRAADLNIFDVAMWFHRPAN